MVRLPFLLVFKHSLHISQGTLYTLVHSNSPFVTVSQMAHRLLTGLIPSFSKLHVHASLVPWPITSFSILLLTLSIIVADFMIDVLSLQVHWLEGYVGCRVTEGASSKAPPEPSTGHDEPCSGWDLSAWCQGEHGIPHQH